MAKKILLCLLAIFFLFSLVLLAIGLSPQGLGLVVKIAERASGGALAIERVEGRLLAGFALENLRLESRVIDLTIAEASLDWDALGLLGGFLQIDEIYGKGIELLVKESNSKTKLNLSLPPFLGIAIDKIGLFDGQITVIKSKLTLASLTGGANLSKMILRLDGLDAKGPDMALNLDGSIDLRGSGPVDLKGGWGLAGFGFHPMRGGFALKGPLQELAVDLSLFQPGDIKIEGVVTKLFTEPGWRAVVRVGEIDLGQWIAHCPSIVITEGYGEFHGDLMSYEGHAQLDGHWGSFDQLELVSRLSGNHQGIDFHSLRIDRLDGFVAADGGSISWRDIFAWEGDLAVTNLDPALFTKALSGRLGGLVRTRGDVLEKGLMASFGLRLVEGRVNDLPLSLTGALQLTEKGITSDFLRLQSGEMKGEAVVTESGFFWGEEKGWQADIRLNDFNPGVFHPLFSGLVRAQLEGQGSWSAAGVQGHLDLAELGGYLGENSLSGGGQLAISDEGLAGGSLFVEAGANRLNIMAEMKEEAELSIFFSSPDLQSLGLDFAGELESNAILLGDLRQPRVKLDLQATELGYQKIAADALNLSLELDLGSKDFTTKVLGQGLRLAGKSFLMGEFEAGGSLANHQGRAILKTEAGSIEGQFSGGYAGFWQGSLQQLQSDLAAGFTLENEAPLILGKDEIRLESLCLVPRSEDAGGSARACLEGIMEQGEAGMSWSTSLDLAGFPLAAINQIWQVPLVIDGLAELSLFCNGDQNGVLAGEGMARVSQGRIEYLEEDEDLHPLLVSDALLKASLAEQSLSLVAEVDAGAGGHLSLDANLDNVGSFATSLLSIPLGGELNIEQLDLAPLSFLSLYGVAAQGVLGSSLRFSGNLASPQIEGEIKLVDGGVNLMQQGIFLSDIHAELGADTMGAKLKVRAVSGNGWVEIEGRIAGSLAEPSGSLAINARDFLLIELPEYSFTVNSDTVFQFTGKKASLKGELGVVEGYLEPEELSNIATESADVIFTDDLALESRGRNLPVVLDLRVIIDESLKVDGYGLRGNLGGQLQMRKPARGRIVGDGTLDLTNASFSLYGRTLDIGRGRIFFTGPIDNPGVDIRAKKTVKDSQARGAGYTVGIDINGLVQDLQYQLYSDPAMTDTEIISHLVVGNSLTGNDESDSLLRATSKRLGVGAGAKMLEGISGIFIDDVHFEGDARNEDVSLVVGKRLFERLYIGYDINMFSELGSFRVRYDLGRGFWVETSSSTDSFGADLFFSIDR